MSRLPERTNPKESMVICVEPDVMQTIDAYTYSYTSVFKSKSQFFESLIHLVFIDCCEDEPPRRFLEELQRVGQHYDSQKLLAKQIDRKERLHITLDEDAKAYVYTMLKKYPALFTTQSRFFSLILLYAQQYLTSSESIEYFEERLKEAMRKFPTRSDQKRNKD